MPVIVATLSLSRRGECSTQSSGMRKCFRVAGHEARAESGGCGCDEAVALAQGHALPRVVAAPATGALALGSVEPCDSESGDLSLRPLLRPRPTSDRP